ncbi:MAG: hypothetical protein SV186_04845 [Candidatus Nanohaloarchaea archaeon]|nr:hypothetical protein [Candidatus Nanohaloarchaea archaeon]
MYRPVDAAAVPDALTDTDRWVCWQEEQRDGKPTKVPVDPATDGYASVSDPETWNGFNTAYRHYRGHRDVAGVGYVFVADGPYVGVDLDDCRDPGTGALDEWAQDIITRLDSYTEVSPSGSGVHVIARGEKQDGKHRDDDVELYDRDRYFTVTGQRLDLTPGAIAERSEALQQVHDAYLADPDDGQQPAEPPTDNESEALTDAEIIERASNAENGEKFRRLWMGDTSGYPSHSEADQALCNILAFWTGGDEDRIEWLFNQSGLTRQKWNERPDYRERTIQKAIKDCSEYYDP